ncbi:thioredoxin domain-containing protein [Alicycliphilus sp. B1]|nr:thioredoxin domain-containing protein [Alicycliphilus sp. B1]
MQGPAVLEFGTPWCGHCQRAQPLIEQALKDQAGVQHLKVEDGPWPPPWAAATASSSWPTLIFLRNGQEAARLVRPQTRARSRRRCEALRHDAPRRTGSAPPRSRSRGAAALRRLRRPAKTGLGIDLGRNEYRDTSNAWGRWAPRPTGTGWTNTTRTATNLWSPDAPIALAGTRTPAARCGAARAARRCAGAYLRYTEYGGYYEEERIRPLRSELIASLNPP